MSTLAQESVLAIPVGNLAEQSSQSLFELKSNAAAAQTQAKATGAISITHPRMLLEIFWFP